MQRRITLTAATLIIAMLCTRAMAQQASPADKLFIKGAAVCNMLDVKLSEAALQQSQSQDVKQFAQKIIDDHKKALEDVRALAAKKSVEIPADLPQDQQECLKTIQSLSGKDFDEAYICAMKAGHAAAVSVLEDKSQIAKDADIKQFAAQMLPKLRDHKQQVAALAQSQLGITTEEARTAGARIGGTDTGNSSATPSGGTSGGTSTDNSGAAPKNP